MFGRFHGRRRMFAWLGLGLAQVLWSACLDTQDGCSGPWFGCESSADCERGEICVDRTCDPPGVCHESWQCPPEMPVCEYARCVECASGRDCPEDRPVCLGSSCGPCSLDADCYSPDESIFGPPQYCVAGRCGFDPPPGSPDTGPAEPESPDAGPICAPVPGPPGACGTDADCVQSARPACAPEVGACVPCPAEVEGCPRVCGLRPGAPRCTPLVCSRTPCEHLFRCLPARITAAECPPGAGQSAVTGECVSRDLRTPAGRALAEQMRWVRFDGAEPFEMSETEVTTDQYAACQSAGRCIRSAAEPVEPGHAAQGISWQDAAAFAAFVGGRLPRLDEWQRAAGLPGSRWPWGDAPLDCEHARMRDCRNTVGPFAGPVCHLEAGRSPQGLCDLVGNVAEWLADEPGASEHLCIGGGYQTRPEDMPARRAPGPAELDGTLSVGIRVVRTPPPPPVVPVDAALPRTDAGPSDASPPPADAARPPTD